MIKETKTKNSSWGAKNDCLNFELCPLCFGCRNAKKDDFACSNCYEDEKYNICNTSLHKPHLVSKMIIQQKVKLEDTDGNNK